MPWMNVVTSKTLSAPQPEELKAGFAAIMLKVLDKQEAGLNVSFVTADQFYRAGESSMNAAAIDIKYINKVTAPQKQEVTDAVVDVMIKAAQFDPAKVIVLFTEFAKEDYCRKQ